MECMCTECGMSSYLPADLIKMDPSAYDSNQIDSLLVCQNCGGKLRLVGKAGNEPFYRLK
jgi:DNA-directed RNA polymerase subunit RPC12/RpoP